MRSLSWFLVVLWGLATYVYSQEVFRFNVEVSAVYVDVFVTRDGKSVTGLTADNFEDAASAALDALVKRPEIDAAQIGVYSISLGSFWGLRFAARDRRIRAIAAPANHPPSAHANITVTTCAPNPRSLVSDDIFNRPSSATPPPLFTSAVISSYSRSSFSRLDQLDPALQSHLLRQASHYSPSAPC